MWLLFFSLFLFCCVGSCLCMVNVSFACVLCVFCKCLLCVLCVLVISPVFKNCLSVWLCVMCLCLVFFCFVFVLVFVSFGICLWFGIELCVMCGMVN